VLAGRLLLAAVFAAAGLAKAVDLAASVRAVRAYRVLPETLAVPVAHALPFVELALAVLLVVGLATRLAAIVAVGLLAVFVAGIVSAGARGLRVDCGCFGGGGTVGQTHYLTEVVRDLALLAVGLAVARWRPGALAADDRLAPPTPETRAPVGSGPRARAATARAEATAARLARRHLLVSAGAAAGLLLAAGAGLAAGREPRLDSTIAPPGVTAAGGVVVGRPDAPVRLVAYEDPQCPHCADFEAQDGPAVAAAIQAGRVSVEYRMRSFLGPESVRAVAALGAAQAAGGFEALRPLLFAHQPGERTGGFTVDDLVRLGALAGITDARYAAAVRAGAYTAWAHRVDDRASRDGNVGTPELRRDGRPLDVATELPGLLAG